MSLPGEIELFEIENGNAGLEVHHHQDGTRTYWLVGGVGAIMFDSEDFFELTNLIMTYAQEVGQ